MYTRHRLQRLHEFFDTPHGCPVITVERAQSGIEVDLDPAVRCWRLIGPAQAVQHDIGRGQQALSDRCEECGRIGPCLAELARQVDCLDELLGGHELGGKRARNGLVAGIELLILLGQLACLIVQVPGMQPIGGRDTQAQHGNDAGSRMQAAPPTEFDVMLQQFGRRQIEFQRFARDGGQGRDFRRGGQKVVGNAQCTCEAGHVDQSRAERRIGIELCLCAVELTAGIEQQHMQPGFARQDTLSAEIELRLRDFVRGVSGQLRGCVAADEA